MTNKVTYSVVVRDPNSWDAKTRIHLLLRDCGHNHRAPQGAVRCMDKLTKVTGGTWGNGGMMSAAWFHSQVEDSNGEVIDPLRLPGGKMTDTKRITSDVYYRFPDVDEDPLDDPPAEEYEDPMATAIGIRNGLILGIIFWGLVLVAILLIRGCK